MIIDFDNLQQQEYDSWGSTLPSHLWCNQRNTEIEVDFIINKMKIKKDDNNLDLFCAWGRHTLPLNKKAYRVIGLDISRELIEKAFKIAKENNIDITYINCDIKHYKSDILFDNIISVQSSFFEAWRNEQEIALLLQKVKKLLKPGGKYLFGWNNNYNRADEALKRWKMKLNKAGPGLENDNRFYFYSFKEQKAILEKNGYEIFRVFNNFKDDGFKENTDGLIMIVKSKME